MLPLLNSKHHELLLHDNELKWHTVNQISEMVLSGDVVFNWIKIFL